MVACFDPVVRSDGGQAAPAGRCRRDTQMPNSEDPQSVRCLFSSPAVTDQVVRFTVQRFKGWKRNRSIFMLFQLLNREPLNREPE